MSRPEKLRYPAFWFTAGLGVFAVLVYLSVGNVALPSEYGIDKVGHLAAYALLTLWLMQIVRRRAYRLALVAALVATAVAMELLQEGLWYRSRSLADLLAGIGGVLLGWIIAPPRTPNLFRRVESAVAPPREQ